MNKICKILGAIATVGATAVAGILLYRKGYDNGFDYALRKNDDDYDFDDFDYDDDYEEDASEGVKTVYCDNDNKELGFTFPQFIQAVEILSRPNTGLAELVKEMGVDSCTGMNLLVYIRKHNYHCGGNE